MALIGTIRRNSWILVVMLALGLGGFIIMDMTSSRQLGGGADFTVGKVNGTKIDLQEMQTAERALYGNSDVEFYNRRSYLWNFFVEEALIKDEAEAIGLSVGDTELDDLQFGVNLSPVVRRNFTDPNTNQVNRQNLNEFKQALDGGTLAPEYQQFWVYQQKEVIKDRLQTKLVSLVDKALYTPTWMAEMYNNEISGSTDFRYVMIPYDQVSDSDIEVDEEDYKNYLKENKAMYENAEQKRVATYIQLDVIATAGDSLNIIEDLDELKPEFLNAENDSLFVENNFGTLARIYHLKEDFAPEIGDSLFALSAGEVYGPYIDEGSYKLAKLIDRKPIADSVRSRHILFSVQNQEQVASAQALADSVKNMLASGVESFDSLAVRFSDDKVAAEKGGDLGFAAPGTMVQPFNDMIFYEAEPGEIKTVYTQFGIHLVEVTDRKYLNNNEGIKLAFISLPIVPSETTQEIEYEKALELVSGYRNLENLRAAAEEDSLLLSETPAVVKNEFNLGGIAPGNTARDIIRWMYEPSTEVGDVAPQVYAVEDIENYFDSKYLVVALERIIPKGTPPVDAVKSEIEAAVVNKKKGEYLVSQIENTDLQSLADQFGVEIDSVENMNFNMSSLRGIGNEPRVIAMGSVLKEGQISKPIIGENGVYVIQVYAKILPGLPKDIAQLRRQSNMQMRNAVTFALVEALRENASITDNRYTYY